MIAASAGVKATALGGALAACDDVSVVYRVGAAQIVALADVTLAVDPVSRVGLSGRSGSGKTTLLHVLGGLTAPTSGSATWAASAPPADATGSHGILPSGVGYVFQSPQLLPYFTALENVRFAARASGADPRELLALVGLSGKHEHLPGELSGGEQQRVAIARALAQQPRLLLCDEPTGRLDTDTAARVLDLIDALQEARSFAIVTASHDPTVLGRYAREVNLVDGRIIGDTRRP